MMVTHPRQSQELREEQLSPAVAVAVAVAAPAAAAQQLLSDHLLTPVAVPQRLVTRYKMLVL